jgi:hypothetical protein
VEERRWLDWEEASGTERRSREIGDDFAFWKSSLGWGWGENAVWWVETRSASLFQIRRRSTRFDSLAWCGGCCKSEMCGCVFPDEEGQESGVRACVAVCERMCDGGR